MRIDHGGISYDNLTTDYGSEEALAVMPTRLADRAPARPLAIFRRCISRISAMLVAAALTLGSPAQALAPDVVPDLGTGLLRQLADDCERTGAGCTWEHVIGGMLDDEAHAITEMPSGGYALAGHTRSNGSRNRDAWIVRLSPRGKVVWQQVIGGPLTEKVFGIVATEDDGLAIVGKTYSVGAGGADVFVARFTPSGKMAWQKTFGGPGNDEARAILRPAAGGLLVVGTRGGERDSDLWVLRLNENGGLVWARTYGTQGEDGAVSAVEARDGGFAIAGYAQRPGLSSFDNWVVRLDGTGELLWQRHFARGVFSSGTGISPAPDGGFFVAGISQQRTPRDSKSWVIRLAADGKTVWQRLSQDSGSNEAWGAATTADGGVVVVSAAQFGGLGQSDARLVRFSPSGDIVWSRLHGSAAWSRPTAVITTRDGGILVTGYTTGRGAGYQDVWVLRLDSEGRLNPR